VYKEKVKRVISITFIVFLLVIIGITFGGRERISLIENIIISIVSPVNSFFSSIGDKVQDFIDPVQNIWENEKLVVELEEENNKLKDELKMNVMSQIELDQLKNLRDMFNYIPRSTLDNIVGANVVTYGTGNLYNTFVIDKGSEDGITKDSTVLIGEGLVGLVYEVGEKYSKVVSIIDNNTSIGFEVLNTVRNYDGIIKGTQDKILNGMVYDLDAQIIEGDILVTSGKGIYPKGIIIGRVSKILEDKDSLTLNIEVKSDVDFAKMNIVTVIPYELMEFQDEE
jgi:rod shape-determining protein MreC